MKVSREDMVVVILVSGKVSQGLGNTSGLYKIVRRSKSIE